MIDGTLTLGELHGLLHLPADADRADALARHRARLRASARPRRACALFEILDREPRIASPPDAPPLPAGNGRVELRDVSFAYEDGPPALRDIDLAVDGGTTVALVGATGSGKSTLVSLLGRDSTT